MWFKKPDLFFDTKKQGKNNSAGPTVHLNPIQLVHLNHPKPSQTNTKCIVVGMAGFAGRFILGKVYGYSMLMGTRLQACKAPEQDLGGHLEETSNTAIAQPGCPWFSNKFNGFQVSTKC